MKEVIGLDRRIKRAWLDGLLDRLSKESDPAVLRKFLHQLLAEDHPGEASRARTISMVMRIWVLIPKDRLRLRERALELLPNVSGDQRLWLHWGMAAVSYPFFRDVAEVIGRLLALQDDFTVGQVQSRLVKDWGDRTMTKRAAQQVVNSMADWGAMRTGSVAGHFLVAKKRNGAPPDLQLWLLEALLCAMKTTELEAQQLLRLPATFPFEISVGVRELRSCDRFEIHRQGLDMDMVSLAAPKPARPEPQRKTERVEPRSLFEAGADGTTALPEERQGEPVSVLDGVAAIPTCNGRVEMIIRLWEEVGGTLIEQPACAKGIDAVILPQGEKRRFGPEQPDGILQGQDILVVQADPGRLGLDLMGRAVFGAALLKKFRPRSVRCLALCGADDPDLSVLLAPFPHVEVVVQPPSDANASTTE